MMLFSVLALAVAIHALDTVQYGAFTQTATYSVANQLGFFTAYGLNVVFQQVPNSTFAYATVLSGGYDILTGTIDNNVNLRLNSNESLTVVGQLDQGPDIVLAAIPNITTVEQLKGKSLMVDSPVSGYAYLLRSVLSSFGLLLENGDFTFTTVGSTNIRYADLVAGELPNGTAAIGTILTYPFTAEGEGLPVTQQPNTLARISDFVNPITSSAFTIRQSALSNSTLTNLLTRFVSAMYAANLFLQDPSKQACSVDAIRRQLNVSEDVANLEFTAATNNDTGEVSPGGNFTVNQEALLNIIAVRKQFGGFSGLPADFDFDAAIVPGEGQLIDYSIRDAAVKELKGFLLHRTCLG